MKEIQKPKKWNKSQKLKKIEGLKLLENEVARIAEEEIIKTEYDQNLMKKIFYVQKLIKELKTRINMGLIRTDQKYDVKLKIITATLELNMDE